VKPLATRAREDFNSRDDSGVIFTVAVYYIGLACIGTIAGVGVVAIVGIIGYTIGRFI
jgi:hypothetical protein